MMEEGFGGGGFGGGGMGGIDPEIRRFTFHPSYELKLTIQ